MGSPASSVLKQDTVAYHHYIVLHNCRSDDLTLYTLYMLTTSHHDDQDVKLRVPHMSGQKQLPPRCHSCVMTSLFHGMCCNSGLESTRQVFREDVQEPADVQKLLKEIGLDHTGYQLSAIWSL